MRLAPGTVFFCDAFLFDMDGTLVDSTSAVTLVWKRWGERVGIDADSFLASVQGVRCIDSLKNLAVPGLDPKVEARFLEQAEIETIDGVKAIPGALSVLRALAPSAWAVVTSASRSLMQARFRAAGLPLPAEAVCAEDVSEGKPSPLGFRLGAERLGVSIDRCIVFEDSKAGITAGRRSGAKVVAIASTLSEAALKDEDWITDMTCLRITPGENGARWTLSILPP